MSELADFFAAFNSTTLDLIWLNPLWIPYNQFKATVPTICLEPDKILMADSTSDWNFVDAITGEQLLNYSLGSYNSLLEPPVYHIHKQILIGDNNNGESAMALNISDSNPANWNEIWEFPYDDPDGKGPTNAIIVDDYVMLTDQESNVKVVDVDTGKLLWKDQVSKYGGEDSMIAAGIDKNGEPVLIIDIYEGVFAFR